MLSPAKLAGPWDYTDTLIGTRLVKEQAYRYSYKYHNGLVTINSRYWPTQQAMGRRPWYIHPLPESYPVPSCRTDYRMFSCFLHTIVNQSSLPEDVASAPTLKSFQSQLSKCTSLTASAILGENLIAGIFLNTVNQSMWQWYHESSSTQTVLLCWGSWFIAVYLIHYEVYVNSVVGYFVWQGLEVIGSVSFSLLKSFLW